MNERLEAVRKAHGMIAGVKTLDAALPVPQLLVAAESELWRVDDVSNFGVRLQEIRKDLNRLLDDMAAY